MIDCLYYTNIDEALCSAVAQNKMHHVQVLLKRGANVNYKKDAKKVTPLCWAAMSPDGADVFELLLQHGSKPNIANAEGRTPLHFAAMCGSQHIVSILLRDANKVNVNATDVDNYSSLYYAAQAGHTEIVKLLLQKGANVEGVFNNIITKKLGQWFNQKNKTKYTPLMAAVKNWHQDITQALVEAYANVNAKDYWNNTALHHAVNAQDIQTIVLLIKSGADVRIKNNDGHTPKMMVRLYNKETVLNYLLSNMKNRLGWHISSLDNASRWVTLLEGDERVVLFLLSQMSRAKRNGLLLTDYPVGLSFNIVGCINTARQKVCQHLPTEIWQRIAAFWLQDVLSLDADIKQVDTTMGYLFGRMNDFLQSTRTNRSAF